MVVEGLIKTKFEKDVTVDDAKADEFYKQNIENLKKPKSVKAKPYSCKV